jgi:hypothetical protein
VGDTATWREYDWRQHALRRRRKDDRQHVMGTTQRQALLPRMEVESRVPERHEWDVMKRPTTTSLYCLEGSSCHAGLCDTNETSTSCLDTKGMSRQGQRQEAILPRHEGRVDVFASPRKGCRDEDSDNQVLWPKSSPIQA